MRPGVSKESERLILHFVSGTKVRTGDFASSEPEFRAEFWETNFGPPNSWVEFYDSVFSSKRGPLKNSPLRNSPPKIRFPKYNPEIGHHRVLQGAPPPGRHLYFTFPSTPDPLFKASKAPFLTSKVAIPSGAPRQAPLEGKKVHIAPLHCRAISVSSDSLRLRGALFRNSGGPLQGWRRRETLSLLRSSSRANSARTFLMEVRT